MDRLLSDGELAVIIDRMDGFGEADFWFALIKAQDAKSIAARDKEWVVGTQPIIDSFIEFIKHGDYSNGNEAQGCDEGEHLAAHHLRYLIEKWQQLKKDMGVKESGE